MTQSMTQPLVSIIITTHNRSQLLCKAIDSVLNQDYRPIEVIVVNDASSDNTVEILQHYISQHPDLIKVIHNDKSRGACYARNRGLELASGVFATGLDDDDEFLPNRLSKLVAAYDDRFAFVSAGMIERHPDIDYAVHNQPKIVRYSDCLYANIVGNQVLTKRERFLAIGGFDEKLRAFQDYDTWLRLLEQFGDAKHIPDLLYVQNNHHGGQQISFSSNKVKGHLQFLKKHRHNMTQAHLKSHAIESLRIQKQAMSLKQFLQYSGIRTFKPALRYYLKSNFAFITQLKKYLQGHHSGH